MQLFTNNGSTTLANAVLVGDTTITVVDAGKFPASNFKVTLEAIDRSVNEIMLVTGVAGNVLTVTRAQEDTVANEFAIGSKVEVRVTAEFLNDLQALVEGMVDDAVISTTKTWSSSKVSTELGGKAETTHSHLNATTSTDGFMSSADKTKLDGVATGANNYDHPTGDGNLHVPATGTTNNGKVLTAGATAGSLSWTAIPSALVSSVAGKTGTVTLTKADVGLGNVDNTSDINKPISNAVQSALDVKANVTHTHTVSEITDFVSAVDAKIQAVVGAAPAALDTLGEIATQLANDQDAVSALTTVVAGKADTIHTHGVGDVTGLQTALDGKSDTGHVHSNATTSVAGFMSTADKSKLDSIATNANNYVHPTGDGNLHVPATGTTNAGKVLTAGSTAGSLSWTTIPAAPVSSVAGKTGVVTLVKADVELGNVDNTSDANKPVSTATQTALNAKQNTITGAATTVTASNLTASMAMVTDASGKIAAHGNVSVTELGYLDGVTSSIQTQLNNKASSTHAHTIVDVTGLQAALDAKATIDDATTSTAKTWSSSKIETELALSGGSGSSSSSFTVTEETLTANRTLTEADAGTWLFATTASRVIFLPATPTKDIEFNIVYVGTSIAVYLEIKCTGDTNYFTRLYSGATAKIAFDSATGKWTLYGNGYLATRTAENTYSVDESTSIGYAANGSSTGIAIGNSAIGFSLGTAIGNNANGSISGVAVGRNAIGSNKGVAVGYYANATKQYGSAIGAYSRQERYGGHARSGDDAVSSKLQVEEVHWAGTTTNATATELFLHGVSANRCILLASSVLGFTVRVTGIASTTFEVIDLELKGTIKRDASYKTTLVGTVTSTVINNELTGATAVLTADDISDALKLTVTGLADTTINWGAVGLLLDRRI